MGVDGKYMRDAIKGGFEGRSGKRARLHVVERTRKRWGTTDAALRRHVRRWATEVDGGTTEIASVAQSPDRIKRNSW